MYGEVEDGLLHVLCSKSRWSSINLMFQRLLPVKEEFIYLSPECIYQPEQLQIGSTFELIAAIMWIINSAFFWDSIDHAVITFDMVCRWICVWESDSTSTSTHFASLLFVRVHVRSAEWIQKTQHTIFEAWFMWQANKIHSPICSILYVYDPFFSIREHLTAKYNHYFLQFDVSPINSHCQYSGRMLADSDRHYNQPLEEFMQLSNKIIELVQKLADWHPRLLWSQLKDVKHALSAVLIESFKAPSSTDGIERHHKAAKHVHTYRRETVGEGNVEKQV